MKQKALWVTAAIENGYQELEAKYEYFRTQKYETVEQRTAAFASVYALWLAIIAEVKHLLAGSTQMATCISSGSTTTQTPVSH